MSRRGQIRMSEEELARFLDEQRTVICATVGHDGWPHLMPLWYVVREGELWAWTYAKSQKARNLERDPRCTLQVEAGESYDQLRGVMVKARCEILRELDDVAALGREVYARAAGGELTPEVAAMVDKQAAKRVALRFRPESVVTWDHRKLATGVY